MLSLKEAEAPRLAELRPVWGRSISAAVCLCAELVLAVLLIAAHSWRLVLLREIAMGGPVERESLVTSDAVILVLSRVSVVLWLASAVAFLVWLHRASSNLRAFRSEPALEFTPGQAVGSFFIPFVNLFRPYAVLREVWRASDASVAAESYSSVAVSRGSWLVVAWWLLFLGRNLPAWWTAIARQMGGSPLESLISATYGALAMYVLTVPAACAAILLVVLVGRRQRAFGGILSQGLGKTGAVGVAVDAV
jgi:hypothetical protein